MMDWKEILKSLSGIYIDSPRQVSNLISMKGVTYFCSSCSKTKSRESGMPKDFYISRRLLMFYSYCEYYGFGYGILSDKYGIHFMDEVLAYYDIHPSTLTESDFMGLGKKVRYKCKQRKISRLIFWNTSPLMSRPYFRILYYSQMKYYYMTKLYKLGGFNLL